MKDRKASISLWMALMLALVTLAGATGCGKNGTSAGAGAEPKTGGVLHIGYGKGGSLDIVRLQGTLAKRLAPQGVTVEWLNFPMGPQMMEGIGAGSVDLGAAASTPPIFAQAAGVPFVYAANIPPGKSSAGVLVPKGSPIQSVRDLKGKRIAFQPGSVWQYDLVKLLEEAGLRYSDIVPMKMPPADANAAFNSGSVDAWVQGEPYVTLAQRKSGARLMADVTRFNSTGGFYLAAASTFKTHPEWLRAALEEIQKAGDWAQQHPHDAALLTATNVGLDVPTVEQMIREGTNDHLQPIDAMTVAQQQEQADLFVRLGVLPHAIRVQDVILTPEQYARILPAANKSPQRSASTL